jgi:cytosine/adenosine deaminase-related metal-dependent hydrolase
VLPGLINAHDHLEFSLFPRLGSGPYHNFREWAEDVYRPDQFPVRDQRQIPKSVRIWWGALKNLLSGVTTVCHHNPPIPGPLNEQLPIRVLRQYGWAHSLAYGGDITQAFRATPPNAAFIIHLAEGTDESSKGEIFELDRRGALSPQTAIVHGVGLDAAGHELLEQSGASLVWCPTSNLFTLGRTVDGRNVMQHRRVALGSDSAMTARGDLLDEIRYAHSEASVSSERTYSMVTDSAAEVLHLPHGAGKLARGFPADLIAVRDERFSPCDTLVNLRHEHLELVMVGGEPRLLSRNLANRRPENSLEGFEPLHVGSMEKLVKAPVTALLQQARACLGDEVRLAGRLIAT